MSSATSPGVNDEERLDTTFSALADRTRREVLFYFLESGTDVAAVEELVAHVADSAAGPDSRERASITLHHVALPTLCEAGLLAFDAGEEVRYRGGPLVEECLQLVTESGTVA